MGGFSGLNAWFPIGLNVLFPFGSNAWFPIGLTPSCRLVSFTTSASHRCCTQAFGALATAR